MSGNILYDIRNLRHRYENGPVTVDIDSLQITEGSVTGLVGPNGSGKSTLLRILAFLEPAEGEILFGGAKTRGREVELRRGVTYLLQDSYLLKRTVFDNIAYGLKLRGETDGLTERVNEAMLRVGLSPEKFGERLWYRLSGGEVQRAALAARLALRPRVLLLDEPTANVDEASAQLVKEAALTAWKERGTTVIVATHDLVWLYEVSTDIFSLYRGRLAGRGAENLIQGVWSADGERAVRRAADGQIIFGFHGGKTDITTGVVSPSDVTLTREEPSADGGKNILRGSVSQMALERGEGSILVSTDIGGIVVKVRLTTEMAQSENLCPSSRVWASFPADKVRWL